MIILTDTNNIVIDFGETVEQVENGIKLNKENCSIIYIKDIVLQHYDVETLPVDYKRDKYCYSVTDGFTVNQDYKEYKTPEQEIADLKAQLAETQIAVNMALGL